jgi:hypothetical protein
MRVSRAAKCSAGLFLVLGVFQAALVAGAPWGEASWGGQHRDALPASLRIASAVSVVVALALAAMVGGRLRVPFRRRRVLSGLLVFFVLSVATNTASRSSIERLIWVPYGMVQFATIWLARRIERTNGADH